MSNPAISLVMPVYNVESFLSKALTSVENQTFKDFEMIIVDDGSSDKSYEIAEEFCIKNPNFKLIKQENSGPAAARNTGVMHCKGEYIAFMDSDDYLEKNFLEELYKLAKKTGADITCCNFNMYFPNKKLKIYMPFNSLPGVYTKSKALRKLILDVSVHYFIWNKLYKRELFMERNIKFDDMYFEDISTSPRLFYFAKTVAFTSKALYNYTMRENSILHSINAKKVNDYIKALGIIKSFLEENNDYEKYSGHVWIYAQRVKFVVYYYIINLHLKALNFKGFGKNISCAMKSINYFTDKKTNGNIENIDVPYKVKDPQQKS